MFYFFLIANSNNYSASNTISNITGELNELNSSSFTKFEPSLTKKSATQVKKQSDSSSNNNTEEEEQRDQFNINFKSSFLMMNPSIVNTKTMTRTVAKRNKTNAPAIHASSSLHSIKSHQMTSSNKPNKNPPPSSNSNHQLPSLLSQSPLNTSLNNSYLNEADYNGKKNFDVLS